MAQIPEYKKVVSGFQPEGSPGLHGDHDLSLVAHRHRAINKLALGCGAVSGQIMVHQIVKIDLKNLRDLIAALDAAFEAVK